MAERRRMKSELVCSEVIKAMRTAFETAADASQTECGEWLRRRECECGEADTSRS